MAGQALACLKAGTADLAGGQALGWRVRPRPGELSVSCTGSALPFSLPLGSRSPRLLASVNPSHTKNDPNEVEFSLFSFQI